MNHKNRFQMAERSPAKVNCRKLLE